MAMAAQKARIFLLPQKKIQVTVISQEEEDFPGSMDMLDSVSIAAMEGFQGFGVWCGQLMTPPVFGKTLEEDEESVTMKSIRQKQRERERDYIHRALSEAGRRQVQTVFLPFISATGTKLDDLIPEWLVDALTTLDVSSCFTSLLHPLKRVVVVGEDAEVAGILTHLAARLEEVQLKKAPQARRGIFQSVYSFFRVRKRLGEKVEAPQPSNAKPCLPHHTPSPQSQSTASQSVGGSSSSSNNGSNSSSSSSSSSSPMTEAARSSHIQMQRFADAYSETNMIIFFGNGGHISKWKNPLTYEFAGQWAAAQGQSGDDRRGGGLEPAPSVTRGQKSGPSVLLAQYFCLYDANGKMHATYFSMRDVFGFKGGVDYGVTSNIRHCYRDQSVSGYYGGSLEHYIVDVADRPRVDRDKKQDISAAGTTSQPERSDGETSSTRAVEEEETTLGDCSKAPDSEQAARVQAPEGGEEDSSKDSDDDDDDDCAVCLGTLQRPTKLIQCNHVFCRQCLERSFQERPRCPMCQEVIVVTSGNMPDGSMHVYGAPFKLPGYEQFNTIVIQYMIYSGVQLDNHPNPGVPFQGTRRVAYLPASKEGFKVCRLLWVAFKLRMTFTVGLSLTTGHDNVVVWNDIHHRTRVDGGPEYFGYPDPQYLSRVTDELASKGITERFIRGFSIPF